MRLVVDALATSRITRLVTRDTLTRPLREATIAAIYRHASRFSAEDEAAQFGWTDVAISDGHDAPRLATLVTCSHCASVWVAFGVVAARRLTPRLWEPVAVALALSAVAGMIAEREP